MIAPVRSYAAEIKPVKQHSRAKLILQSRRPNAGLGLHHKQFFSKLSSLAVCEHRTQRHKPIVTSRVVMKVGSTWRRTAKAKCLQGHEAAMNANHSQKNGSEILKRYIYALRCGVLLGG